MDRIPCIQKKAAWALRWIQSSNCFAERLVRSGGGAGAAGEHVWVGRAGAAACCDRHALQPHAATSLTHLRMHLHKCVAQVAYACVEGIHFSGSFCSIFWLKKRQLMPGEQRPALPALFRLFGHAVSGSRSGSSCPVSSGLLCLPCFVCLVAQRFGSKSGSSCPVSSRAAALPMHHLQSRGTSQTDLLMVPLSPLAHS